MYDAIKKVMTWLYTESLPASSSKAKPVPISQNVVQPVAQPLYWWQPDPVIEPEPEIEPQFNPVWAALGMIGTLGDVFVPSSYQAPSHVSVDSFQPITVNLSIPSHICAFIPCNICSWITSRTCTFSTIISSQYDNSSC